LSGGSGEIVEMVDTIFVSGLPDDILEDGLVQHFGSIGVIKVRYCLCWNVSCQVLTVLIRRHLNVTSDQIIVLKCMMDVAKKIDPGFFVCFFSLQTDKRTGKPKVWIYKDKISGRPKGEATITYDDSETAKAAINWFNGTQLLSDT
jgi:RNA recognition motif-containing protein